MGFSVEAWQGAERRRPNPCLCPLILYFSGLGSLPQGQTDPGRASQRSPSGTLLACHELFSSYLTDINWSFQRPNSIKCMWFSEYPINSIKVKYAVATNHQMKEGKTHILTHGFIAVAEGQTLSCLVPPGPNMPSYPAEEEGELLAWWLYWQWPIV